MKMLDYVGVCELLNINSISLSHNIEIWFVICGCVSVCLLVIAKLQWFFFLQCAIRLSHTHSINKHISCFS